MNDRIPKAFGIAIGVAVVAGAVWVSMLPVKYRGEARERIGANLGCIEQVLGVSGLSSVEGAESKPVLRKRLAFVEGVLEIPAPRHNASFEGRLGRIYGAALRLEHDIRPCLGANPEPEQA